MAGGDLAVRVLIEDFCRQSCSNRPSRRSGAQGPSAGVGSTAEQRRERHGGMSLVFGCGARVCWCVGYLRFCVCLCPELLDTGIQYVAESMWPKACVCRQVAHKLIPCVPAAEANRVLRGWICAQKRFPKAVWEVTSTSRLSQFSSCVHKQVQLLSLQAGQ